MQISEETRGGAVVITAAGRLDSSTAAALETSLSACIQANPATVLDLSGVPYVSSAGLRVLLIGAKAARAKSHRLVLSGLSESVREVFDISGFTSIFAIEPDLDSALVTLG